MLVTRAVSSTPLTTRVLQRGGMMRLETLIELKVINSSLSTRVLKREGGHSCLRCCRLESLDGELLV